MTTPELSCGRSSTSRSEIMTRETARVLFSAIVHDGIDPSRPPREDRAGGGAVMRALDLFSGACAPLHKMGG